MNTRREGRWWKRIAADVIEDDQHRSKCVRDWQANRVDNWASQWQVKQGGLVGFAGEEQLTASWPHSAASGLKDWQEEPVWFHCFMSRGFNRGPANNERTMRFFVRGWLPLSMRTWLPCALLRQDAGARPLQARIRTKTNCPRGDLR